MITCAVVRMIKAIARPVSEHSHRDNASPPRLSSRFINPVCETVDSWPAGDTGMPLLVDLL